MARSVTQRMITVGIAVSALLAGCSGDDSEDSSPDTSKWTEAANALCGAVNPAPLPADTLVDLDQLPADLLEQVLGSYRQAADDATTWATEAQQLAGAPDGAAPLLSEVATDAELIRAALEAADDAGTDGLALAGARLRLTSNDVAQQLDLDDCTDRLGTWSTALASSQPLLPDVVCLQAPGFVDQFAVPDAASLEDVQPVVCEEPHDVERYLTFEARPGNGIDYPGQIFLAEQAAAQCNATFEDAAGAPALSDPSSYVALVPDAATWQSGERQITCVRLDPGGDQLTRGDSEGQTQEN